MELILTQEQQEKLAAIESEVESSDSAGWFLRVLDEGVLSVDTVVRALKILIERGKAHDAER